MGRYNYIGKLVLQSFFLILRSFWIRSSAISIWIFSIGEIVAASAFLLATYKRASSYSTHPSLRSNLWFLSWSANPWRQSKLRRAVALQGFNVFMHHRVVGVLCQHHPPTSDQRGCFSGLNTGAFAKQLKNTTTCFDCMLNNSKTIRQSCPLSTLSADSQVEHQHGLCHSCQKDTLPSVDSHLLHQLSEKRAPSKAWV